MVKRNNFSGISKISIKYGQVNNFQSIPEDTMNPMTDQFKALDTK